MASVSGKSTISSILRKSVSVQQRINESRGQTKVRFELPQSSVRDILNNFLNDLDVKAYQSLVIKIRDAELTDDDVHNLLEEATACVSVLNCELRLFVESMLCLRWTDRSEEVVNEYQSFIINLLSAHVYHSNYAINKLIDNFIPDPEDPDWVDGFPKDEDCKKCTSVHWVLNILFTILPMCEEQVIKSLISHFPYMTKPVHTHEFYVHNMLWILEYYPKLRPEILLLIFNQLIVLDTNSPRDNILQQEVEENIFVMDENISSQRHEAQSLDVCMDKIFNYVISESHNGADELCWDRLKTLYFDLLKVFESVILPSYNIHHVQFVMFVLCCLKTTVAEAFLNYLWKKVYTPTEPVVIRQTAVAYIASLVARCSAIPLAMLKGTLQQMAAWIHAYILNQDGQEFAHVDPRVHSVFYSVCQALFYVVAFRQEDLVNSRKNVAFVESLNLAKMVTCRLNPLRVCQPAVVQNFAAVTRTYQFAYCYAIMENNARNKMQTVHIDDCGTSVVCGNLEAFFPFEPYLLRRSRKQIIPFYVNFQNPPESNQLDNEEEDDGIKKCDIDDFLMSTNHDRFSYGTSPGFKFTN